MGKVRGCKDLYYLVIKTTNAHLHSRWHYFCSRLHILNTFHYNSFLSCLACGNQAEKIHLILTSYLATQFLINCILINRIAFEKLSQPLSYFTRIKIAVAIAYNLTKTHQLELEIRLVETLTY